VDPDKKEKREYKVKLVSEDGKKGCKDKLKIYYLK